MPKIMSREAEKFVINCIEKVCELVEDTSIHPTDAVEKVARDKKLTPEYIRLVSHGYNIGRQTHQRKTASTVLEKLSEFPLADPASVIAKIYPSKILTPAEEKEAAAISSEYFRPPRAKEAEFKPLGLSFNESLTIKTDLGYQRDPVDEFKKAKSKAASYVKEVEEAGIKKAGSYMKIGEAIDALRKYVKIRTPFDLMQKRAGQYFGKAGLELLEFVRPPKQVFKHATADFNLDEFKSLLHDCLVAVRDYSFAKKAYDDTVEKAKTSIDTVMSPYTFEPKIKSVVNRQKMSSIFSATLLASNIAKDKFEPPDNTTKIEKIYKDLEYSPAATQIRQLQARTQLEDYLRNDEIISGYDPSEVAEAFNEITAVAPRLANQPTMMRALLRKRLAQGYLEPFEAGELANMEKTIGQSRGELN